MTARTLPILLLLALGGAGYLGYRLLSPAGEEASTSSRPSRFRVGPALTDRSPATALEAESRAASQPSGPENAAPPPGTVRGRVVDRGGIALNHATVTVVLHTPPGERNYALVSDYRETAKVDGEGKFSFAVPGGGVYRFTAEAEGFAPALKEGVRPGDDIELVADVGATLEVRATDKIGGKAVEGVLVVFRAPKFAVLRRAKTPADGVVKFVDLPAGVGTVTAEHDEFVPRLNVEQKLEVGENAVFALELDPGKSIKGQVLSADEQRPIEGAVVTVRKKTVATDAGGRFLVKGLAPEPHEIRTASEGFLANERSVNLAGSRAQAECEIFLDRGATVRGRVVNEQGESVVDAELKLFESWGGGEETSMWEDWSLRHLKAKTGQDGSFKISGIAPQPWSQRTLRVRHPLYADAFERGIKLAKKDDEIFVAITLRAGGAISGRVTDDQNRPLAGARVELRARNTYEGYQETENELGEQTWKETNLTVAGSDAEGAFAFANLSEGRYELRVEAKGWSTGYRGDLKLSKGGRLEGLQITLEKGEPLKGYVVDGEEKPLAGANVHVSTKNGNASAVSGADGTFQIDTIPKGPYDVSASAVGFASTNLRKQMPEGDRGLRIVIKKQGLIRGKVVDVATKKPVVGAWLELQKEEPRWGNSMRTWAWAESDKQGEFKLQADNGTYQLRCGANGYVRHRKDDVDVSADKNDAEPLTIELKRGGAVEGFVRGPDGKPDSGTTVYWRKDDPNALFTYGGNSEADGYYFCGDLDAGSYEVVFQRPGYPIELQRGVFVGGDRPAQVDVQFRTDARLVLAMIWKDPPKPAAPEGETVAGSVEIGVRETPAVATPKPRRNPRPNVWIEALDDVPLSLDWENKNGEEGQRLGRRKWIWLGGGQRGVTLSDLPAGRYRIRAEAKGHEAFERIFALQNGGSTTLEVEMQPVAGYVPPGEPTLRRGSWIDENGERQTYWYQEDG